MKTATNSVANTATENTPVFSIEETQVRLICEHVKFAINLKTDGRTGMEPMVIRRDNITIDGGICDLIECHGSYTVPVIEKAIFALKDSELITPDTMVEFTKSDGFITAISFKIPKVRFRQGIFLM